MNKRKKINLIEKKKLQLEHHLFTVRFIGNLIFEGKKMKALRKFSEVLQKLKLKLGIPGIYSFFMIMVKSVPEMLLVKALKGGKKVMVPKVIKAKCQISTIIKWTLRHLRLKKKCTVENVTNELLNSLEKKGQVEEKKKEIYEEIKREYGVVMKKAKAKK